MRTVTILASVAALAAAAPAAPKGEDWKIGCDVDHSDPEDVVCSYYNAASKIQRRGEPHESTPTMSEYGETTTSMPRYGASTTTSKGYAAPKFSSPKGYDAPKHTSPAGYDAPKHTWTTGYMRPTSSSSAHYAAPTSSSAHYAAPKSSSSAHYDTPKHTSFEYEHPKSSSSTHHAVTMHSSWASEEEDPWWESYEPTYHHRQAYDMPTLTYTPSYHMPEPSHESASYAMPSGYISSVLSYGWSHKSSSTPAPYAKPPKPTSPSSRMGYATPTPCTSEHSFSLVSHSETKSTASHINMPTSMPQCEFQEPECYDCDEHPEKCETCNFMYKCGKKMACEYKTFPHMATLCAEEGEQCPLEWHTDVDSGSEDEDEGEPEHHESEEEGDSEDESEGEEHEDASTSSKPAHASTKWMTATKGHAKPSTSSKVYGYHTSPSASSKGYATPTPAHTSAYAAPTHKPEGTSGPEAPHGPDSKAH